MRSTVVEGRPILSMPFHEAMSSLIFSYLRDKSLWLKCANERVAIIATERANDCRDCRTLYAHLWEKPISVNQKRIEYCVYHGDYDHYEKRTHSCRLLPRIAESHTGGVTATTTNAYQTPIIFFYKDGSVSLSAPNALNTGCHCQKTDSAYNYNDKQ